MNNGNFLQEFAYIRNFLCFKFANSENVRIFAPQFCQKQNAQMAESVDALVSNTSGATHPGSTPGLGTWYKVNPLQAFSLQGIVRY